MALTYGFYNSVNGDRKYNAEQMSAIFDGIIRDGVFQEIGARFRVRPEAGNVLIVETGKAWFNGTWILNDSLLRLTPEPADVLQARIDAVVIEVDKREAVRASSIKIIKGVANNSPRKPQMLEGEFIFQHPIAYIHRKANSDRNISVSDIEIVVGRSECPFISGILQVANIDAQMEQYTAKMRESLEHNQNELNGAIAKTTSEITRWVEGIQRALNSTDVSGLGVKIDKANRVIWIEIYQNSWEEFTVGRDTMYKYTLNLPQINVNDNPILVKTPTRGTYGNMAVYLKAYDREFSKIIAGETTTGKVILFALKKPSMDLYAGLKGV